jgi:predicted nucleotidyltransferase
MGIRQRPVAKAVVSRPRGRGLADGLFTKTQQRVLSLFFGQPERSFLKTELIEEADTGSGSVQRALARLVETGLVTVTVTRGRKQYQANRDVPIFDELRGIVTKSFAMAEPLRAALEPLAAQIHLALVYGSVASGEVRAGSDLDLLVVAEELTLEELFSSLMAVEKQVGRKIQPTLYTPSDYARRRKTGNPFLKKVLTGEHIVLIGEVDRDDGS